MPELLKFEPGELTFRYELGKQLFCTLKLTNVTKDPVAFKVKTTAPKKYCVRPNGGIIQPQASCDVTFTMQAQKQIPEDYQCKDKFLVQSTKVHSGTTMSSIQPEMFKPDETKDASETKLRVVYVPCEPAEGSQRGGNFVFGSAPPSALLPRSSRSRLPLLFVLLVAVAAAFVGYYMVGQS